MTGTWVAQAGRHVFYEMPLQQSGDTISGVVCAAGTGVVWFRSAPVRGDHPRIRFEVTPASTSPCCAHMAGNGFSGRVDGTKDIVGGLLPGSVDIRFKRSSDPTICPG